MKENKFFICMHFSHNFFFSSFKMRLLWNKSIIISQCSSRWIYFIEKKFYFISVSISIGFFFCVVSIYFFPMTGKNVKIKWKKSATKNCISGNSTEIFIIIKVQIWSKWVYKRKILRHYFKRMKTFIRNENRIVLHKISYNAIVILSSYKKNSKTKRETFSLNYHTHKFIVCHKKRRRCCLSHKKRRKWKIEW